MQQNNALTDDNPFEDLSYAEVLAELNKPRHLSNYTNADRVYDFHAATHRPINQWPPTEGELVLRTDLIWEEWNEVQDELIPFNSISIDKKKLAKELADLLYVVYGTAISFGIDIDRVFEEVHKSNMSKLGDDGKPVHRDDGKVMKGPNYRLPDLSFVT